MMILHDVHTRQRSVEIRFVNDYCYECMWNMRESKREREKMGEKMSEKESEKTERLE